MKKRISKFLVIIMILPLTISSTAFAESVTLEMRTLSSYYKNHHNVIGWGAFDSNITVFQIGSEYAFCTQAGNGIRDGAGNAWDGSSFFNSDYTISQITQDNSMQSKIAYLGFLQHKDNSEIWNDQVTRDWYYAMTQMMIWQTLPAANITANGMTNGKYNSYFLNPSMSSEYESFRQRVQAKLNTWDTKPSFDGYTKNHKITAGETITITDTRGVFEDYNSFSYTQDGISVAHIKGSNMITVNADKACMQKNVVMTRSSLAAVNAVKYNSQAKINYTYSANRSQNLAVYGYIDPIDLALSFDVDIITGKIAIEKTKSPDAASNEQLPEAGAKFEIYLKSAGSYSAASEEYRDIIITDSQGKAVTKDLPHGIYSVHQSMGAEGHKLAEDFDVIIGSEEHDKVYTYEINNDTLKSKVRIVKIDAETGKTIPRAGVEYELTNLITGAKLPGTSADGYFVTDKDGTIDLPEPLYYGRYLLTEITPPEGYVLANPVEFNVDGSEETLVINQSDYAQKGVIKISKTGSLFSSVTEKDGTYIPVYEDSGLSGVKFEIYAAEDIKTPEGTIRAEKGQIVDTVTTDAEGKAQSKQLYLGKYEVKETEGRNGFVHDDRAYKAELRYAGQTVNVTDTCVNIENTRQKVRINLFKSVENDILFGIYGKDVYKDIRFGLFAAEDITAADGEKIPEDGLIEVIGIKKCGGLYYGQFTADLPNAKYYVKEVSANEKYLSDETKYPVDFTYTDKASEVVSITVNGGNPIENDIIRGKVKGLKTDGNGSPIKGAIIGLFKEDEEDFTEKNAIMTAESDECGQFEFTDIAYGSYVVREIKTAPGYALTGEIFPVSVLENEAEIVISMVNEKTRLEISKKDITTGEELAGATMQILDSTGEVIDEWVSEEEPHYIEMLPVGNYILREKLAPLGYATSQDVKFTVRDTADIQKVAMLDDIIKVQITKTDENGKALAGAVLQLIGNDGEMIDQWVSTGEPHRLAGIPAGRYIIHEVKSPEGYQMTKDIVIDVVDTADVQEFEFSNALIPKTGDRTSIWTWILVAFMSLGAIGRLVAGKISKLM